MGTYMPTLACKVCKKDQFFDCDASGVLYCIGCGEVCVCQTCDRAISVDHLVRDPHTAGVPGGGRMGRLSDTAPAAPVRTPGTTLYGLCGDTWRPHAEHPAFAPVTRGAAGSADTRWFTATCVGVRRISAAAVSAALSRENGPRAKHSEVRRQGVRVRAHSPFRVNVTVDYDVRAHGLDVFAAAWQALTRAGYLLVADDDWADRGDISRFSVYGPHTVKRRPRRRAKRE